ncbi:tyrosine-type recombinase/integrase [Caulobacter hibisci]|uniref:Site-specific integrase n=1 Tax=Caulobacter hibisci TaxID=2035993 RepID=A0ABS0SRX2_9CAUL|nr:site-specific integrase [Caulobacter hibisci]MBI1682324.1 site-specific integrase [Caulobacter hibisci]
MPLNLYPRPNGIWHIRGTVQGRRVDQSSRTRIKAEAEAIRAQLEADLFKRSVYGDKAVATFAEAATVYMEADKPTDHLTPLLAEIGLTKLSDIDQNFVDRLAKRMKPGAAPATMIRQVYTPISAVMNFSAPKLCDPVKFAKPKGAGQRVDYLTPREAAILLGFLPEHLGRLVTFYLATGCRASEALGLEWRDVSPDGHRVVFWDTKKEYPRGVDLQRRARTMLPDRLDEAQALVFRNKAGEPWHEYDAVNLMLKRHCARHSPTGKRLTKAEVDAGALTFRPVHCHLFRHTWATWAYAVTRDLTFLMSQGGWRSATMVLRYVHTASPDLAKAVKRAGWEIDGRSISGARQSLTA